MFAKVLKEGKSAWVVRQIAIYYFETAYKTIPKDDYQQVFNLYKLLPDMTLEEFLINIMDIDKRIAEQEIPHFLKFLEKIFQKNKPDLYIFLARNYHYRLEISGYLETHYPEYEKFKVFHFYKMRNYYEKQQASWNDQTFIRSLEELKDHYGEDLSFFTLVNFYQPINKPCLLRPECQEILIKTTETEMKHKIKNYSWEFVYALPYMHDYPFSKRFVCQEIDDLFDEFYEEE